VDAEKALGRTSPAEISSLVGYAGGAAVGAMAVVGGWGRGCGWGAGGGWCAPAGLRPRIRARPTSRTDPRPPPDCNPQSGPNNKVCYYYSDPRTIYERLGHAEVVQVALSPGDEAAQAAEFRWGAGGGWRGGGAEAAAGTACGRAWRPPALPLPAPRLPPDAAVAALTAPHPHPQTARNPQAHRGHLLLPIPAADAAAPRVTHPPPPPNKPLATPRRFADTDFSQFQRQTQRPRAQPTPLRPPQKPPATPRRFADTYFSQFQRLRNGKMQRLDPQDFGAGYRNVVGIPGGVGSPLFKVGG
jgi:hypothetical protein